MKHDAINRRIALVSAAGETRTTLAAYLKETGFEVHPCEELALPGAFAALVVITAQEISSSDLVAEIRSWMRLTRGQRVIVVTSKPTALKHLLTTYDDRLQVLPAPVFGWELVDALRAAQPTRPRGA